METDLKIRLQTYAEAAEVHSPSSTSISPSLFADALSSAAAAAAIESASIICSHTRVLRDRLEALKTAQPAAGEDDQAGTEAAGPEAQAQRRLTFAPGENTLEKIAMGAAGIPLIKNG